MKHRTKVAPGIYRIDATGNHVALIKKNGEQFYEDLDTNSLSEAKRKTLQFRRDLERLKHDARNMRLADLVEKFKVSIQNQAAETKVGKNGVLKKLQITWKDNPKVSEILPSQCVAFLETYPGQSRHRQALNVLREMFNIAIDDGAITDNPTAKLKQRRKVRTQKLIPTAEQAAKIIETVRERRGGEQTKESGDFVEAIRLFGLGQAEIAPMAWKDIDWDRNRAQAYRKKTKVPFTTFISPALKKFLEYKYAEACAEGRSGPEDRIFKISNPIAAIKGAVKKLGYPNFTARSLRRTFIKDLLDLKIHPKTIGKTQGHQDGGMLILNTYSEFFDEDYDVAIKAIENKIN